MITISNLAMQFGGSVLFKQVDLQFVPGNCYGIIGANGAGKSTFLKILSGELEATSGQISIKPGARMSVLKQDQNQYDAYTILDTVIMGNQHLYDVMKEKDALYEKPDFSEEDGMRASELEAEFADMDGWEAESDASKLLQGLGIPVELHYDLMGNTDPRLKVISFCTIKTGRMPPCSLPTTGLRSAKNISPRLTIMFSHSAVWSGQRRKNNM